MRDLSRPETNAVRETHGPDAISSLCRACGQPLPCDALTLAEEVDLLRSFEQVQRDERRRLEERARRYRNVYQRTADVLYGFWLITFLLAPPATFLTYQIVPNPEEWQLAGVSALGLAWTMYGLSRLFLREPPAKRTGIAILVFGVCWLALIVGEALVLNLD